MPKNTSFVLSTGTPGVTVPTPVWKYNWASGGTQAWLGTSYLGPVIVPTRGIPTEIKYVNALPADSIDSNVLFWQGAVDQTLNWANPTGFVGNPLTTPYHGTIPAVPHLHGGEVPAQLDGGPDSWFTSDGSHIGHAYYSKDNLNPKNYAIYRYPNKQEAANIWFHDHGLGITRLNVYAGLAGAYVIKDDGTIALPNNLNDPTKIIPVVLQDRMFDPSGNLYFPSAGLNPNIHPFWVPEFVGDTTVVKGKTWPSSSFCQPQPLPGATASCS